MDCFAKNIFCLHYNKQIDYEGSHSMEKNIFSKNTFNLLQDSAHKIYSGLG